jgi:hypothetical protein
MELDPDAAFAQFAPGLVRFEYPEREDAAYAFAWHRNVSLAY